MSAETPTPQGGDERITRHFAWHPVYLFKNGDYRMVWLRHYYIFWTWRPRGQHPGWQRVRLFLPRTGEAPDTIPAHH